MLNLNTVNIRQARATVRTHGHVYLHGCGNMYVEEIDSKFRKEFTNVNKDSTPHPSTYVVKFTDVKQIPGNIEDLEELFLRTKNQELKEAAKPKSTTSVKTVKVEDSDGDGISDDQEEDGEVSFSKRRAFMNPDLDRVVKSKAVDGDEHNRKIQEEEEERQQEAEDNARAHEAKDSRIADLEAKLAAMLNTPPAGQVVDTRTPAQKRADTIAANKSGDVKTEDGTEKV